MNFTLFCFGTRLINYNKQQQVFKKYDKDNDHNEILCSINKINKIEVPCYFVVGAVKIVEGVGGQSYSRSN